MNFFDKIYYFLYCMVIGGQERRDEARNESHRLSPQLKAKQLFIISIIIYMYGFMAYSGLIYLIKDRNVRLNAILFLGFMVAILSFWYLSWNGKDKRIIIYFNGTRKGPNKKDATFGLLILSGSFLSVLAYVWLKTFLPLPFLQHIM